MITPKTGFLGRTVKEIANALENFDYDPLYCHRYAIENFHSDRMAKDNMELYNKVLNGVKLNKRPIFQPENDKVNYIL